MQHRVTTHREWISLVQHRVTTHREWISLVQHRVTTHREWVSLVQHRVTTHREWVSLVQHRVTTHREWISLVQHRVTTHREWVSLVQHRVHTVRSLSLSQNWYWVGIKDNPADIPTRKDSCEELIKNELWWNGPSFLKEKQPAEWPDQIEVNNESVDPAITHELKKTSKVFTCLISEGGADKLTCQKRIDLHKIIDINRYSI